MFREMRRKTQQLPDAETIKMLQTCTSGVLAAAGDEDYPYAVPLSFAYEDGKIYFHSARSGHKLDAIGRNEKVSFCVIQQDEVSEVEFTTHYRSAIVFGRARILTEDGEKRHAMECLVRKYSPALFDEGQKEIDNDWNNLHAIEIAIEHMTGKAAK